MDGIFGEENYVGQIAFRKTEGQSVKLLPSTYDFLLHYAKDHERIKFTSLFTAKDPGEEGETIYVG
jgi:adenine-specific DNA-methyltransferase